MSKTDWKNEGDIPPPYTLYQHACVSLNMSDRLRLMRFPLNIVGLIRDAIIASWPRGLQKEKQESEVYEFKLNGNPWWGQGDESVSSRILIAHVLSVLYNAGWYLLTSTDISKKLLDKDSLIFQLGTPPPHTPIFAISFNDYDKLRLISAPLELISTVRQALGPDWIHREEWRDGGAAYQFKLFVTIFLIFLWDCIYRRGNPWLCNGEDVNSTRLKLLSLLDCFSKIGWKLHASIDISQGHEGRDTDSWFFRRDD